MIFCHSSNMTSLNTFFSFFNMSASEFLKRYRKYMLKVNIKEIEDEKGMVDCIEIYYNHESKEYEYIE